MPLMRSLKAVVKRTRGSFKTPSRAHSSGVITKVNEESLDRYSKGGYHPVRIGDSFNHGVYKVVNKLGYGQYSTVWLAQDTRQSHHVALKIVTADAFDEPHPTFELDILRTLSSHQDFQWFGHVLRLVDEFKHNGPNGEHVCLVFKAMGPDLSKFRTLFPNARIPVPLLKKIVKQLLLALSFLHDTHGIIHTDIKPQNILTETTEINDMFKHAPSEVFAPDSVPDPPNDFYLRSEQISSGEEDLTAETTALSVRLTDFGTSSWSNRHLTEWIQPQMLRAPEVIVGAPWDHRVDIWNLGTLTWELTEGKVLFDGTATPGAPYTPEAHLAQIMSVLGKLPEPLLQKGNRAKQFFNDKGDLLVPSPFPACTLEGFSNYPESQDKTDYWGFLRLMLTLDPRERPDASKLLEAQWLRELQ